MTVMSNRKLIIVCGAILVIGIPVAVFGATSNASSGDITYTIDGADTSANSVTYSTDQGQEQINGTGLPWSVTVKPGGVASVVAQADAAAYQSIHCSITQGGKVIASQTSYGSAAVVTCSAST